MKKNNKLVPRLRFQEFKNSPSWKKYQLKEISNRITQKVENNKLITLSISAGIGFISQAEKFNRDISGKQYNNYIYLKKGDFSYNKGNSKKFPQGCIYELKEYDEAAVPNVFISFKFKYDFISYFYHGYFDNNFHGKQLIKFITSSARSDGLLNISADDFFSIILPTPEKKEQQKIADCLDSIDDLIEAEKRKLEVLKKYKKALMQKLFLAEDASIPELRFAEFKDSGEWERKSIGESCSMFSGGTPLTHKKEFYGGEIPFIRSAEIYKNITELYITDSGLNNSSAKMVKKGDILIALYGANSGEIALSKIDGAINQAILCLRHETNNSFFYQYFSYIKECITSQYLQGGQGNLSAQIIKSIILLFPNEKEQKKIADCLASIDSIIDSQVKRIDNLIKHKKALMQGLFPDMESIEDYE